MAAPASNPSHLLISRNPRSPAHPQLASTTTTSLSSPQPPAHLFSFDAASTAGGSTAGGAGSSIHGGSTHHAFFSNINLNSPPSMNPNPNNHPYGFMHTHGSPDPTINASSFTVGVSSISVTAPAPAHIRSHSTPMFPTTPDLDEDEDEDEDDITVHPTFCRDAALPGRVKVIVGRYEFWCHKEVLWFASPFFNALLQGCWAETSAAAGGSKSKPSSPTDTDTCHADRIRDQGCGSEPFAFDVDDATAEGQGEREPEGEVSVTITSAGASALRAQSVTPLGTLAASVPAAAAPAHAPHAPTLVTQPALEPVPSHVTALAHSHSPRSSWSYHSARRSRQSLGVEDSDSDPKASVYLDAEDGGHGPSVADILRELRELPEPSGAALDAIEGRAVLEVEDNMGLLIPVVASPPPAHLASSASVSPPLTPHTPPTSALIPPERPRSAPAPSPSSPAASASAGAGASASPLALALAPLSPPLPLRLQGMTAVCPPTVTPASARRASQQGSTFDPMVAAWPGRAAPSPATADKNVEAVVELHEESPGAFQDFLFWAYPHLECKVTWTNVEGLLALSSKLIVPALQSLCERFLMTHASGRPIVALALAEQHANAELYREASRFVLDQAAWDTSEIAYLSEPTQLKLSQRRTWFLERLLKLGSIDPKKEYTCRPDCPDPSRCQAQLDEKWRQAHQAVSRYGPPQPSVAFRCLRQLETFPTNPSLVMPHPLCQTAAKSWIMTLFDRMFQPKMAFGAMSPGTEKYWLYITLS